MGKTHKKQIVKEVAAVPQWKGQARINGGVNDAGRR